MQTYPAGAVYYGRATNPATYDEPLTTEQSIRVEAAHAAAQIFTGLGANQGTRFKAMASLIEKWIAEGK